MINFLKQLLDYIYKEQCYLCRRTVEDVPLCSKCYKEILKNEANHAYTIEIIDGVPYYWAGFYSKNMQKLIRGLKYHGQKRLAPTLAKFFLCKIRLITDDFPTLDFPANAISGSLFPGKSFVDAAEIKNSTLCKFIFDLTAGWMAFAPSKHPVYLLKYWELLPSVYLAQYSTPYRYF